jgi:hypothetical protein
MTDATLDREKLVKICGLFSSEHDGERAAAAARADRMIRAAGLRWPDVIMRAAAPDPNPITGITDPFRMADYCLDFRDTILTAWETQFCRSVGLRAANGGRVSPKQRAILREIFEKCQRHGARGRA